MDTGTLCNGGAEASIAQRTTDKTQQVASNMTISDNDPGKVVNAGKTWKEVETEMDKKLTWVREEIKKMKQQDQSLMRQFLNLRSVINHMKVSRFGSMGNVSSVDSSYEELDERSLDEVTSSSASNLMEDHLSSLSSFMRGRTASLSGSGKFSDAPRLVTKEVFL